MRLFLGWSGTRGRRFAETLCAWLPQLFGPKLKPFVSTQIPIGAAWRPELDKHLAQADAAVLCLTSESLESVWASYELGVLTTSARSRPKPSIFPYLLGIGMGELTGPFAAYQAASASSRDDSLRLVEAIGAIMPKRERPDSRRLRERFDRLWDDLEREVQGILSVPRVDIFEGLESLFLRKAFKESIFEAAQQNWLDRYAAIRITLDRLAEYRPTVRKLGDASKVKLFERLVSEVESYAASCRLLVGHTFVIDENGRLDIEATTAALVEHRRQVVNTVVKRLAEVASNKARTGDG